MSDSIQDRVNKLESQLGRLYQTVRAQHERVIEDHKRINDLVTRVSELEADVAAARSRTMRDIAAQEVAALDESNRIHQKFLVVDQALRDNADAIGGSIADQLCARNSQEWDVAAIAARVELAATIISRDLDMNEMWTAADEAEARADGEAMADEMLRLEAQGGGR